MNKYLSVNYLTKNFQATLKEYSGTYNLSKLFSHPKARDLKETFQIIALMTGIQKITNKIWYGRLIRNDPPDFEAMTYDLDENGKECELSADIENIKIPNIVHNQTNNFSEEGIAEFVYRKKPPHKLGSETILGIYAEFDKKDLNFPKLSEEIKKRYKSNNEIWIYGRISGKFWFITKLNPNYKLPIIYKP